MPSYVNPRTLSKQQQRIVDVLRPWPQSLDEIADMVGTTRQVVYNQIFKIRERGGPQIENEYGRGYRLVETQKDAK